MGATADQQSNHRIQRWARLAMRRMEDAAQRFLGLDLQEDGAVQVEGSTELRRTVDLCEPFRSVAHNVQLLRDQPERTLEFYEVYSALCMRMGPRADSFEGQVEVFQRAIDAVPCERRPMLRRVA